MNDKSIYITLQDKRRLRKLILYCDLFSEQEQKILRKLDYDVSRGRVVKDNTEIPQNIVAINSRVELKELVWNAEFIIKLVFPEDLDDMHSRENRVSILSPVGLSLLGSKIGDIIDCREPWSVYQLVVERIAHCEDCTAPYNQREKAIGKMKVIELMRPVAEFPRISADVTFLEAIDALEVADWRYKSGSAPERVVLVFGKDDTIIGKISPMDVVRGLEPTYSSIEGLKSNPYYTLIRSSYETMKKNIELWGDSFGELWLKANDLKVRAFVKMPPENQMVHVDDQIEAAFHIFMATRHGSLFVLEKSRIVGLILFSDIYKKIKKAIRKLPPAPPTAA